MSDRELIGRGQAKSARWMADQGTDAAFWRRVADQHEWHAENSLRNARRALERADTARRSGDAHFLLCKEQIATSEQRRELRPSTVHDALGGAGPRNTTDAGPEGAHAAFPA